MHNNVKTLSYDHYKYYTRYDYHYHVIPSFISEKNYLLKAGEVEQGVTEVTFC
jgi:hypothetical protein